MSEPVKHEVFADDGQLEQQWFTVDGKKEGVFRAWFGGKLWMEAQFSQGKRHGRFRTWDFLMEPGQPRRLLRDEWYDNGEPCGTFKEWSRAGVLIDMKVYSEDTVEHKTWHDTGVLSLHSTKVNDKLHGAYKTWYHGGHPKVDATYFMGEVQRMRYWNEGGGLVLDLYYENGKQYTPKAWKQLQLTRVATLAFCFQVAENRRTPMIEEKQREELKLGGKEPVGVDTFERSTIHEPLLKPLIYSFVTQWGAPTGR